MSKKYAWTWNVKEESLEEYVKMHLNPWPEIMEAHSKAGIRNYSIFRTADSFSIVLNVTTQPKHLTILTKTKPVSAGMR